MNKPLLRPDLTRSLAARLAEGASINLTAAHGLGRRRTLQDLRSILPKGMRVLYADIKFSRHDCPGTLAELYSQAGLAIEVTHLGALVEALLQNPQPTLLILHNFDLLHPGQTCDPRFTTDLLPYLDTFAQHPQLSLLTVSETTYPDWVLPCEELTLPPLEQSTTIL